MPKVNIAPWNPLEEMLPLREAMSQLLGESFVRPGESPRSQGEVAAPVDISETPQAFFVEVAMPGLKSEDLHITIENNVLTIKGEVRREEQPERTYHRVERRYGAFERSMTLPNTVKSDAIRASLKDGVLMLEIPKAEEVKPRRINVSVGS
ncbi:MAG: Hsp20/alpha crystallin family protein [Chloroflexaceae bacterium]|nr:Hsp20/alpha crystallin family protein [Chloroflexaceae bacterium]